MLVGGSMTTYRQPKAAGTPTWMDLTGPDPAASRAFYHALFGWEYDIGEGFGGYATARLGDRTVAGVVGPQPEGMEIPAAWQLYFASESAASDASRAVSLGATELYPAMDVGPFGSMVTLADPTGAVFSFWQAGSHVGTQVTDEPGSATWYELYSPNAAQASEFYAALLGATADRMPGGLEYYVLKHGEQMLAGIMQIDPSWGNPPPHWVVYFAVANLDETIAAVHANGGAMMGDIDQSPFGRIAALRDASGAVFKVVELRR
jgi:uncharacterized protein